MEKTKIFTIILLTGLILVGTQTKPDYKTRAMPREENLNVKVVDTGHFESLEDANVVTFEKMYEDLLVEKEIMRAMDASEKARVENEIKIQKEAEAARRADIESFGGNPDFLGTLSERALQEAMTQLGKPYYWGAEGVEDYDGDGDIRNGYDCSGLIVWAYHRQGKTDLPRTTKGQWKAGQLIKKKDVQPGDLIYFLNNKKNSPVDHVGIYIGDGKMLHAPEPGRFVEIKKVPWGNMVTIVRQF